MSLGMGSSYYEGFTSTDVDNAEFDGYVAGYQDALDKKPNKYQKALDRIAKEKKESEERERKYRVEEAKRREQLGPEAWKAFITRNENQL
jgi:hypothetical protein